MIRRATDLGVTAQSFDHHHHLISFHPSLHIKYYILPVIHCTIFPPFGQWSSPVVHITLYFLNTHLSPPLLSQLHIRTHSPSATVHHHKQLQLHHHHHHHLQHQHHSNVIWSTHSPSRNSSQNSLSHTSSSVLPSSPHTAKPAFSHHSLSISVDQLYQLLFCFYLPVLCQTTTVWQCVSTALSFSCCHPACCVLLWKENSWCFVSKLLFGCCCFCWCLTLVWNLIWQTWTRAHIPDFWLNFFALKFFCCFSASVLFSLPPFLSFLFLFLLLHRSIHFSVRPSSSFFSVRKCPYLPSDLKKSILYTTLCVWWPKCLYIIICN